MATLDSIASSQKKIARLLHAIAETVMVPGVSTFVMDDFDAPSSLYSTPLSPVLMKSFSANLDGDCAGVSTPKNGSTTIVDNSTDAPLEMAEDLTKTNSILRGSARAFSIKKRISFDVAHSSGIADSCPVDFRSATDLRTSNCSVESKEDMARSENVLDRYSQVSSNAEADSDSPVGSDGNSDDEDDIEVKNMPPGWPMTIPARHGFLEKLHVDEVAARRTYTHQRKRLETSLEQYFFLPCATEMMTVGLQDKAHRLLLRFQNPNALIHRLALVISVVLLISDAILLPYTLAWDILMAGYWRLFQYLAATFWAMDLVACFFRGYYDVDELVTDLRMIACRYLRTWFPLDVIFVSVDWIGILLGGMSMDGVSGGGRFLRLARLSKILRMIAFVRLLRVGRLARVFQHLLEKTLSEQRRFMLMCTSVLICTLFLCHLICCAWYTLGTHILADTGTRWTDLANIGEEGERFHDAPREYQYMTAFHWAVAQLVLGSTDVRPGCSHERIFNVVAMLTGLICGTSLVACLSAQMVDVIISRKQRTTYTKELRQYLCENHVNKNLALAATRQAQERLIASKHKLNSQDVFLLNELSATLRQKIHWEVCHSCVLSQPLFGTLMCLDMKGMQNLCTSCVESVLPRRGDDVFTALTVATGCYCVSSGSLQYNHREDVIKFEDCVVKPKEWLSWAAMWSYWTHVGTAVSTQPCEIFTVSPNGLPEAIAFNPLIRSFMFDYAKIFVKLLQGARPPRYHWPDDREPPCAGLVYAMPRMPPIVRQSTALALLESLREGLTRMSSTVRAQILDDVIGNKIVILQVPEEADKIPTRLLRVEFRCNLRLLDQTERIFVQLARCISGNLLADIRLPNAKCIFEEDPFHVVQDVVKRYMAPLAALGVVVGDIGSPWEFERGNGRRAGFVCGELIKTYSGELQGSVDDLADMIAPTQAAPFEERRAYSSNPSARVSSVVSKTESTRDSHTSTTSTTKSQTMAWLRRSALGPSSQQGEMHIDSSTLPVAYYFSAAHEVAPLISAFDQDKDSLEGHIYTFMYPGEFQYFSSPEGENGLHQWIKMITFPSSSGPETRNAALTLTV